MSPSDPHLFAVIMAGGSGTRFWPASRAARPKQFLPIGGERAMIAETAARLEGLVPPERLLVVTAASQADLVRAALPELPAENVLAEPEARNTAPCVGWAALEVQRRDPDAVMVVLPADHVIRPVAAFRETLVAAAEAARAGGLFTFGVEPDHPATGYGYIQAGPELAVVRGQHIHAVERFVEKPDRARAEAFLAEGGFLWNAGIFVWSARAIRAAIAEHAPELHAGLEALAAGADLAATYATLPRQPVDIAILEKARDVRLVPIAYTWNDVGSWRALAELTPEDDAGNRPALSGGARLVAEDASGNLVWAEGDEVIALVGVEGLAVVRAGNATLVCPLERAEEVKRIVERLAAEAPEVL